MRPMMRALRRRCATWISNGTMLYFFVGAVCVAVGLWVFLPLFRAAAPQNLAPVQSLTVLEDRRDALLRSLKELEFDRSTGKIDGEEYATQHADLSAQATHAFDEIEAQSAPRETVFTSAAPSFTTHAAATELELEVLVMRARRKQSDDWQCAQCNRRMKSADRFCASCGASCGAARALEVSSTT